MKLSEVVKEELAPINVTIPVEEVITQSSEVTDETKVIKEDKDTRELLDYIKDSSTKEEIEVEKNKVYFSISSKTEVDVSRTYLVPSRLVVLSIKHFDTAYMKQLEGIIYTKKEELDPNKLMALIYLYEHIQKGKFPMKATCKNFSSLNGKINNVLNKFFNDNIDVIKGIFTMFKSNTD